MFRRPRPLPYLLLAALTCLALLDVACATKKYVRSQTETMGGELNERIEGVESQVEENQTVIADQDQELGELSKTTREALDRAVAAGHLAEGKFLYETVLTDDKVRFEFDDSGLSTEAHEALAVFALGLAEQNANVFIEIQGHTDSIGSEAYNQKLGEERAEAVRRHLSSEHGVALHRMSVISYGESEPVADNSTRPGRSANRRVALVVLQ